MYDVIFCMIGLYNKERSKQDPKKVVVLEKYRLPQLEMVNSSSVL